MIWIPANLFVVNQSSRGDFFLFSIYSPCGIRSGLRGNSFSGFFYIVSFLLVYYACGAAEAIQVPRFNKKLFSVAFAMAFVCTIHVSFLPFAFVHASIHMYPCFSVLLCAQQSKLDSPKYLFPRRVYDLLRSKRCTFEIGCPAFDINGVSFCPMGSTYTTPSCTEY
jgi:hypothetical protein